MSQRGPEKCPPKVPNLTVGLHRRVGVQSKTSQSERIGNMNLTGSKCYPNEIPLKIVCSITGCLMKLVEANGAYIEI